MRCILVLSALVLALVSARPEGYSYYTPHGGSESGGGSATSSASLSFGGGGGGGGAALSSSSSEVEDCDEPSHEQLTPYQHSQLHYFTPQVLHTAVGLSGSSSSSGSGSSSSSSSLYLGAAAGHDYQHHSQPAVHVQESASGASSGLYHYQAEPKVVTQQVHHHAEPQVEYFTDVHQHQQTHHEHAHHKPATVHYVQQPVVKEEVHKHIYVHVAPEEKEEIHQKVILPTYTKQKHYKIIFIKAPSPPTVGKVVLPQQPANEEKTLVYVLHKKPELEQEIVVPAPATSKPTKPEVYFIKYKTKKEEQHHHHEHQHSYHHEETHQASAGSFGESSTASSLTSGVGGGVEISDLSGYGGSFSTSFAPIVVTEGSYHSTTPAPVKVTTVHPVVLSSSAAPSHGHTAHRKAQSVKVSSVGLSGYSAGGSRQRGTKKPCSSKCSKASSGSLTVTDGGSLDAFVSNVF